MKKIISFILIAILCLGVFTGCDVLENIKDQIGLGGEQQPEGPTLEDAVNFLDDIYKDKNAVTRADFDVVGKVIIDGVSFPVTWSVDIGVIKVRESTKVGYYTVDLPDATEVEFRYTLTATITDGEGRRASKSYIFTVPVVDNSGITSTPVEGTAYKLFLLQGSFGQRYYALNTTQDNKNKFINTTVNPKEGADFYVEKVDGGFKIYTNINGTKTYMYANVTRSEDPDTGTVKFSKFIGFNTEEGSVFTYNEIKGGVWTVTVDNLVYGVGTYGSFTTISLSDESYFTPEKVGDSQFVMQFMTSDYANGLEADKLPDSPSDAEGILNQLYGLADGESAAGSFTLTGKITSLDSYGNPTIVVEGFENKPVYCYRLTDDRFVVDAVITVTATQMKNYSGTYEFMNCTLDKITLPGGSGEVTPPEGDSEIITNPEVGVAYKFGLFHGNEKATVFFNGQNYNNYAWYLAYAADGVDVYLETVEGVDGGYRLFFYNGDAKTYIVAFPRDGDTTKGTLKLDTAVPETYFTFNSEYNTLVYTSVTGEQFYLGSSGTYKSISCSAISYITNADSYISHLYAANGSDTPIDPQPPVHEHKFVDGKCECGETDPNYQPPQQPETGDSIELNVDSLGVESQTYAAGTAIIGGVNFEFIQIGNYGDGIQVRDKADKGTSMIWNTTAFSSPIVKIVLVYSDTKDVTYANPDCEIFSFGNGVDSYTYTTKLSTTAGVKTYEITPDAETYTYFYFEHDLGYTMYWKSITIVLADGSTVTPPAHEHTFVDGKCECGETDPTYQPPHEHTFVDGKCECGETDPNYQPPVVPSEGEWKVTTELKTGDHILIGAPAYGKLLSMVKVATYYNKGVNYSETDFSNVTDDEIFVVTVNADGSIELVSLSGKVVAIGGYSSLDVTGANKTWTIEAKANANGIFYLKNSGTGKYLEWYASKDNWSSYAGTLSDLFELSFYVKSTGGSDTPVDPQPPVHEHTFVDGKCECGETDPNYVPPTVDPVKPTYPVVTELKTGDKIIIGAPAYGKLLSMVKVATYYNKGVDYTVTDFSNVTNDEIFVVTVNADGSIELVSVSGKVVAIGGYSSLDVTGANKTWTVEVKAGAEGIVYLKNSNGKYLEWYASKDNWSTYAGSLSDLFELNFYLYEAAEGGNTPVDPQPPVHEHKFVEGKCECGETDPTYQPPSQPETNKGGSADFDTIALPSNKANGDSSYTATYTTNNGWVTTNSAIQCGGAADINPQFTVVGPDNTHKAVCLNGKTSAVGKVTSPTLKGGISKLTLKYTKMFTDTKLGATITITDLATGAKYTKSISVELPKDEKYQVYTFEWVLETPITGDFTIEVVNDCPSASTSNKDRLTILDLSWE